MSSRAESKSASQFASLTMKLKDKLHPHRYKRSEQIKRSPSQRNKPADLNLQDKCVLADQQRAVVSSLQYFKALVDRLGVERPGVDKLVQDQSVVGRLLGGASSRVLETVQVLVQLEPHLHNSKTISTCLTRLYRSLAQLIRWTDQVMMQGVAHDNKESTASVTTVIRSVLDGVKDLVRLAAERKDGSVSQSPVQLQPALGPTGGFDNQETDRMPTCKSPVSSAGDEDWGRMARGREEQVVLAPPKPPIPIIQVPLPAGVSPPALPPKRRLSSLGPTPCRVAIVAPMRRKSETHQHLQQESEDDECLKRLSYSSADSAADSTHDEEDPDYDFLHKDLSSSETLPPLPAPSSLPPALPEKRRRSTTVTNNSQTPPNFEFNSASCDDVINPDEPLSSPLSPSKTPPPLPEKKRHIHQYLQVCSSYSAQSAAMFYQKASAFNRYNSKQREAETTYQLTHTHLDTETPPDTNFAPSPELPPAPVLPPKKKLQDPAEDDKQNKENSSQSLQQEVEDDGRRSWEEQEEQEEVLLTNKQQILNRIAMKAEDEEGPDVKAASPEILLVYATETDSSTEHAPFCEAFLSTYRSFIDPNDVISKLQHRYRHICDECQPPDPKAARNTFQLLVRVVDELCAIELDSDLLLLLMDLVFSLLIGGELQLAHQLHSNILSKMEQKWKLIGSPHSLRPLAARSVAARPGTLLDFRSQDLAEQLTLLDSELFYKIELPEVLLWSKEQNEEKSPNLTEFTQHFNNVSFWVRSVIILQDKPQDREKLLLKFLKIMKHLRKLNNFNSYLSILSALDSAPLRRLDWQKNTAEALEEYSSLIDSSSSFRAYRAALAEVEPPCIPYLGLILQDLTFVHLGNPDTLMTSQGSKVNFSKRWQQFNILDTLRSYQQARYSVQPNDDIISFFNDFSDHLAEEALWELSLRIRPRNTPRANQR
ncbi:rap guanine nucleotide exchange factor 1 isoform X2 [Anabas testudineus]|uniref:rap guanine nucleotide exchange factor 1 isoform X2 n=1 Tax=Anabas testudineus TaxID=64144 RepID=UPI000E4614D3|nr:rap guanine nucleotide exchange factor 1 isoform X2 [Anabas testudineus]